jgi:hypothetical protein
LSSRFTVVTDDRRGRGNSDDTLPYAVQRAVDDVTALIPMSARRRPPWASPPVPCWCSRPCWAARITKLALYEPPFTVTKDTDPMPADFPDRLDAPHRRRPA